MLVVFKIRKTIKRDSEKTIIFLVIYNCLVGICKFQDFTQNEDDYS